MTETIRGWFDWCLSASARLLLVGGIVWLLISIPRDRERAFSTGRANDGYSLTPRFKTDNAVGATAHAAEWTAMQTAPALINNAIWLGLALYALNSIRRTQFAMERLADELAPLKANTKKPN